MTVITISSLLDENSKFHCVMSVSLVLICKDQMGSDMVEKFLTKWEHRGPRFWWSLFPRPVRTTNSSALGAPAAQEGLASPQDRSVLGWVATPVSIASRAPGKRDSVALPLDVTCFTLTHLWVYVGSRKERNVTFLAIFLEKLNLTLEKDGHKLKGCAQSLLSYTFSACFYFTLLFGPGWCCSAGKKSFRRHQTLHQRFTSALDLSPGLDIHL